MKPAHASKKGRRYRYYITRPTAQPSSEETAAWRLPAASLEEVVLKGLDAFLGDRRRLTEALGVTNAPVEQQQGLEAKARNIQTRLREIEFGGRQSLFVGMVERIDLGKGWIRVTLFQKGLTTLLMGEETPAQDRNGASPTFEIPVSLKKRGVELKLVLSDGRSPDPQPDSTLIALIRQADEWMTDLRRGQAISVRDLARQKAVDRGDVSKALPLFYLAPDIIQAILEGRQPVDLTASRLKRISALPVSWAEQRQLLGFL